MATYLQGQQDYTSQIQPTSPNLQFDAQLLGNMQAKYDAGHKKVSELYGSLLNSAMTRTDNQEARNEFFQMINNDIRRMGSLDFSLQQNVDASANVFQSIYTNKGIVKDMVWTKNFSQQMQKRESLKNSTDTEKTGSAWDVGDRAMAYKREAFANATADEALAMGNAEYVPQQNMMKDAIKLANKAKLNVTIDEVTGKYKITTKNGELIKSPLTTLFSETFAKDPKYKAMYDTKAYVNREDWQHNAVKKGEFADLDQAKIGFLQDIKNRQNKTLQKNYSDLQVDAGFLDESVTKLQKEFSQGKFKQNSYKGKKLGNLLKLQQSANSAKAYTEKLIKAQKSTNPEAAYDVLAANIDNNAAYDMMNRDISGAVRVLSAQDSEITMTPDEFAKINVNHINKMSEMKQKHLYDFERDREKTAAANWRASLVASAKIDAAKGKGSGTKTTKLIQQNADREDLERNYTDSGIKQSARAKLINEGIWKGNGLPSDADIAKVPKLQAQYDKFIKQGYATKAKKMVEMNLLPFTKGSFWEDMKFIDYPEAMTSGLLKMHGDKELLGGTLLDQYIEYIMSSKGLGELEASTLIRKTMESKNSPADMMFDLKF